MSNSTVATVGNVLELDKLREEIRTKLINDALAGKLDITNPTLVTILQDAYKTTVALEPKPETISETTPEPKTTSESKPVQESNSEILCLVEFKGKLISGGVDGKIRVWDPTDLTTSNQVGSHSTGSVNCFVVDNGYLFSGADGEVKVWEWSYSKLERVKTIAFNDVGVKSKVTQIYPHHGVVEVGFDSGIIKYIHKSGFGIAGTPIDLKHSIRNFIRLNKYVYVCTADSIVKLDAYCTKIEQTVEDPRNPRNYSLTWTHIRLIEGELYVFDSRGDIYKIVNDKIEGGRLAISTQTTLNHLYISEYINGRMYIGISGGRIRKFNGFPNYYNFDTYDMCRNPYHKCAIKIGDKLYIGCPSGHIHVQPL